jgi:2-succinyl-5-enolpyruvyl-6-hydroxy-3-cyclohexene-1-carboxylate synthase
MQLPDPEFAAARPQPRPTKRARPAALANRNLLAATAVMDELVRCGVRDLCLSPGSRSAPLALAAAGLERLTVHTHVDERSSAFYALGLARAARRPVALLCSSGSAGANMHPAVVEAFEAGVPLVLLTADRPPRLLDCGAPQTTQQRGLFGEHVLRFQAIGLPRPEATWLRWLRGRIGRMVEVALGPPRGPVHLDLHFDEPLSSVEVPGDVPDALVDEDPVALFGRNDGRPFARWAPAELRPSGEALDEIAGAVRGRPHGVIVVGPLDATSEEATAIPFLADALRVPVLADPLSGLRRPAHGAAELLVGYDAFLRDEAVASSLRPDWILRLGRVPTSKALNAWIARHRDAELFVVDDQGRREDPNHLGGLFVRARTSALCGVLGTAVRGRLDDHPERTRWTDRWRRTERAALDAMAAADREADALFEDRIVRLLVGSMPRGAVLVVSSSMPVRQLDAFLTTGQAPLRLLSNRGVNGIDGQISTTLGVEAGSATPVFALLGDLAALHDVGGLAAASRLGSQATLLVVNNRGGAIFEHLPLATTGQPRFEELFVASHALRFEHAAAMYGLDYEAPETADELAELLARPTDRARIIEVAIDREASVEHHRDLWKRAATAASTALGPS